MLGILCFYIRYVLRMTSLSRKIKEKDNEQTKEKEAMKEKDGQKGKERRASRVCTDWKKRSISPLSHKFPLLHHLKIQTE